MNVLKIYVLLLDYVFLSSFQNGTCILIWKYEKTSFLYIVCNMGFENKTCGLNILIGY
jgi:hypothetical protein